MRVQRTLWKSTVLALAGLLLVVGASAAAGGGSVWANTPKEVSPQLPQPVPTRAAALAYGLNVKGVNYDDDSLDKAIALRVEWIKIYDHPPAERLPFKVLYRVNLPRPGEDWAEWGRYRHIDAQLYAGRIDAYEIGNEPNLIEEWGSNPDPAAYVDLLQIAYREIKSADPNALIVSAGLAPIAFRGDARYVNDLDYLRLMYEHGAADFFDVLALHPFGFGYPPETSPGGKACVAGTSRPLDLDRRMGRRVPEGYCRPVSGQCFRRAELARAIMVAHGDGDKPVWATEFGWIMRPSLCCRARLDWPGTYWQGVSEKQQAAYTVDAFAYADRRWPWMEAMFLWNLDYSRYPAEIDEGCPYCDSMGWYSILNPDGSPRLAYEMLMARP